MVQAVPEDVRTPVPGQCTPVPGQRTPVPGPSSPVDSPFYFKDYRGLHHNLIVRSRKSCSCDGIRCLEKKCRHTVVAMVGLPATGKTYISTKLAHYFNWINIPTKAFNVGEYRRKFFGQYKSHTFFRADNEEGLQQRNEGAQMAIEDVVKYFEQESGEIALFDATNSTRERRKLLVDTFVKAKGYDLFFVESLCDDPDIIEANIRDVKICGKDYQFMDKNLAIEDFLQRIQHYKEQYESLDIVYDSDLSFIQIYNQGDKYIVNRMVGLLESRIVYYLMNIRVLKRTIYLTRHGESEMNQLGRIGGDSDLTDKGKIFAENLAKYIEGENISELNVWTSRKKRTIQTALGISCHKEYLAALDEIDKGICDGMTRDEIRDKYPEEYAAREKHKFVYRYPNGESYQDLVTRLEPIIMELERHTNVLVITHTSLLRCLLAYFMDKTPDAVPDLTIALNTVFKLTSKPYGCNVESINLGNP